MHKTLVALALLLSISSAALTDTSLTAPIASNTVGWISTGAGTGANADKVGRYIVDLGGDFNNDGFKDYAVAGDSVNVYVVLGSASPGRIAALDLSGTPSLTTFIKITLPSAGPKALAAGDINDDGVPDLAIALPDATNPRVFVVYGKAATGTANGGWTVSTMGATIVASDTNLVSDKGFAVKVTGASTLSLAIGDFFSDVKSDLIIGMPEYSSSGTNNEGMVCVVYGKTAETTASTPTSLTKRGDTLVDCTDVTLLNAISGGAAIREGRLYKGASGDKIGIAVAAGASINGDTYKDLFVASQASTTNYLIYGAAPAATLADAPAAIAIDGLADNTNGFKITQTAGAVTTAAYIGNWNGDGNSRPELALGAPGEASNKGKVYILFGQGSSIAATNLPLILNDLKTFGISYTGKTDEAFGYSLDTAGDIDGSGTPDLVVGAPITGTDTSRQTAGTRGKAYILFGSAQNTANVDLTTTTLTSSSIVAITGVEKTGFGLAVSGAGGDLNADTFADFLVGAPFTTKSGATDTVGAVYEFRGQAQSTGGNAPASGFRLHASLLVLASFFVALMF